MNNEKKDWSTLFGISGIIIFVIFFIGMISYNSSFIGVCGVIAGVILILIGLFIYKMEEESKYNERMRENNRIIEKNKKEMSEWFDSKIVEYGINNIDDFIHVRKKNILYISQKYYYWLKDKKLFLFPQKEDFIRWYVSAESSVEYCEENAKLIAINISDIEYFKPIGDISYVTNVESTGINVKGAAIGAVVAGDAGAIIGSRPQIKSKVEERDNRFVELKYKDDGTIKTLKFDYTALDIFREIIPEKEYEYVGFISEKLTEQDKKDTTVSPTLEERFKKLNDLKNAGLITEEEFSDKKSELLKEI